MFVNFLRISEFAFYKEKEEIDKKMKMFEEEYENAKLLIEKFFDIDMIDENIDKIDKEIDSFDEGKFKDFVKINILDICKYYYEGYDLESKPEYSKNFENIVNTALKTVRVNTDNIKRLLKKLIDYEVFANNLNKLYNEFNKYNNLEFFEKNKESNNKFNNIKRDLLMKIDESISKTEDFFDFPDDQYTELQIFIKDLIGKIFEKIDKKYKDKNFIEEYNKYFGTEYKL